MPGQSLRHDHRRSRACGVQQDRLGLDGEIIKRTFRSHALATFQEQFGNVPTAVVCALIAFLQQMYASGQVTYTTGVFPVKRYVRGK
jgi:hypothetical protein